MNKLFRALLVCCGLTFGLVAGFAVASPASPQAGKDYKVLQTAQPTDVPAGKVEVIEFFWYGCPHCAQMEPVLDAWLKKLPPDVVYKRIPVAFRDDFLPHSKMYHALDALGVAEQMTPRVFTEIHANKNYLLTPESQADFMQKNGIDRKKYLDAYNSFSTASAIQRDKKLLSDYRIDGVPTFEIQGKYETSPAQTNSLEGTLQVIDYLVAQIRAKKM